MGGHDFMDWNAARNFGGSDGCVDFEDPDNSGLIPCLCGSGEFGKKAVLNDAYADHCNAVSYADFLVIASESVMIRTRPDYDAGSKSSPTLSFDFRFGRTTVTSCSGTVDLQLPLPNPEEGCNAVKDVFIDRLELGSWRNAAALMGVHTLGRAQSINSGYEGWWVSGEQGRQFSNNYYHAMLVGWDVNQAIGGNPLKNQWKRSDSGPETDMMLDTDLCLAFDTGTTAGQFESPTCQWVSPTEWPDAVLGEDNRTVITVGPQASTCVPRSGQLLPVGASTDDIFDACCGKAGTDKLKGGEPAKVVDGPLKDGFFTAGGAGPAAADVAEFARDEGAWIATFATAWKTATELGFNSA